MGSGLNIYFINKDYLTLRALYIKYKTVSNKGQKQCGIQ